jgi:hypothetical protein
LTESYLGSMEESAPRPRFEVFLFRISHMIHDVGYRRDNDRDCESSDNLGKCVSEPQLDQSRHYHAHIPP